MLTKKTTPFASVMILIAGLQVLPQSGGTFRIDQKVISAGSQPASGGSLAVQNTSGQPVAGPISGGTFTIQAGFWTATALPTAGSVTISGHLLNSRNQPVTRAVIDLTDVYGNVFATRAARDGVFELEVPAGQTYVLTISHRTYRFAPQVLEARDSVSGLELRSIN